MPTNNLWYCQWWSLMSWHEWLFILNDVSDIVDRPTERAAFKRIANQAGYAELIRDYDYPNDN